MAVVALMAGTACGEEIAERQLTHAGAVFRIVELEPERLGLVWRDAKGEPFKWFSEVWKAKEKEGKRLRFLMNAGIYEPGPVPSGLHVEDGRELRPLNLRSGKGNFFLKPNGVFVVTKDGKAEVLESTRYPAFGKPVRLAVQSGPLLLADGVRHPKFRQGSPNLKHRNGVGINGKGQVVFAMTDKRQEVNFWDFAGLFLKLGCEDALFLDGDISQMWVNPKESTGSNVFGAIFVVEDEP
ncbi:MAG: phosphodiester glycosidase family protein [Verrucomicrobiota bacterium]